DAPDRLLRLVKVGHKWQSHRPKFLAFELRHQAVTERLGGHARLVGDEKNGSAAHRLGSLSPEPGPPPRFHRAPREGIPAHARPAGAPLNAFVIPFEQLGMHDVETVGGKNASLGEMIGALTRLGVQVPGGFATTAQAYREFLQQGGLDARIRAELAHLDVDDVAKLAASGARIRQWILSTPFAPSLAHPL